MKRINLSLSSILESVMLNEDGNLKDFKDNKDKINYAIDNQLMISLYYNDGKGDEGRKPAYGNPRGFRRIIPYCLGSRNGRLALRGFHQWKNHTKKGPFKWKFFYLDRMSNVRVYKDMHIPGIPELANPNGDKHMDRIINMIGMKGRTQTPLDRERENTQNLANATSSELNKKGAIKTVGNGNLNSLQNLRPIPSKKKLSYDFQKTKKNIEDWERENNRQQRWRDFDKAEREREEQLKQAEVPNPPTSKPGPVNQQDMEGYENKEF